MYLLFNGKPINIFDIYDISEIICIKPNEWVCNNTYLNLYSIYIEYYEKDFYVNGKPTTNIYFFNIIFKDNKPFMQSKYYTSKEECENKLYEFLRDVNGLAAHVPIYEDKGSLYEYNEKELYEKVKKEFEDKFETISYKLNINYYISNDNETNIFTIIIGLDIFNKNSNSIMLKYSSEDIILCYQQGISFIEIESQKLT